MSQSSPTNAQSAPRTFAAGYLFGIPLGDLGWFGSLLIALASGFFAFFASTFCAIFSILIYNAASHSAVDFAISYKRVGLPIGVAVLLFALVYLGSLWFKRVLRRS